MPTAPAVDRSAAPSATPRGHESSVHDLQPHGPEDVRVGELHAARNLGQRERRGGADHRRTAVSSAQYRATTSVFASSSRERRGATVSETSAMPDANSVVTASTPSTRTTS